jgi:peptide chain release factor 2
VRRVRRPPPIPASSRSSCAGCARASTSSGGVFDESSLRARLEELQIESAHPGLWDQRERAQRVLREKSRVEREVAFFERLSTQLEEVELLLAAARDLEEAELRRLLGGEHDASNAIVSINSGAGGTDACDWAEILSRMYKRWADAHGFAVEELDTQEGEEAGIRSVTFTVSGDYAFGYLKTEEGVHRLVRISPFDSQSRRHTAFASVSVRIDTYRAGGAGGQHVNKTDSAVRITHLPTNVVVQCQNERSQHKNRSAALKVLRARLYERARREQEQKLAAARGEQRQIEFGSQIRSYTLHPQQRVKDHRTGLDAGNVEGVLEGDIDRFIRAILLHRAGVGGDAA